MAGPRDRDVSTGLHRAGAARARLCHHHDWEEQGNQLSVAFQLIGHQPGAARMWGIVSRQEKVLGLLWSRQAAEVGKGCLWCPTHPRLALCP